MTPQQISGSKYAFLGVQFRGRCIETNGVSRPLVQSYFYGPRTGCDQQPNSPGRKRSLITHANGFAARVATPMLAALSIGWINDGIWARWIDMPTDPWESVAPIGTPGASPVGAGAGLTIGTTAVAGALTAGSVTVGGTGYAIGDLIIVPGGTGGLLSVDSIAAGGVVSTLGVFRGGTGYTTAAGPLATTTISYSNPAGDGAVTGDRLPLDNNVTIRKYTAVRGKNWKGTLRPAPIAESQTTGDQLNVAGQAAWKPMVGNAATVEDSVLGMYAPIDDDEESPLFPLLVSTTESQIVRWPTRIAYAPFVLPGIDPVTGAMNALIDLALGESKRRKERKTLTF